MGFGFVSPLPHVALSELGNVRGCGIAEDLAESKTRKRIAKTAIYAKVGQNAL